MPFGAGVGEDVDYAAEVILLLAGNCAMGVGCAGEVGEGAGEFECGECIDEVDEVWYFMWQYADSSHAGIDFEMHLDRLVEFACLFIEFQGIGFRPDGEFQIVHLECVVDFPVKCAEEDPELL